MIILAPWRMIPSRSTCVPIMKPGTSARNSSGTLNASQSQMKRAALSAESTNSTPPRCIGLLATIPTRRPSRRANPMISSLANSGLISKNEPSSTSASITLCMSYARRSSSGIDRRPIGARGGWLGHGATVGGSSRHDVGRYER